MDDADGKDDGGTIAADLKISHSPTSQSQTLYQQGLIPYWNMNIPKSEWTAECPEYLQEVDSHDRAQLCILDADYQRMSWEDVCAIVEDNRLEEFKRTPKDLRDYRKYIGHIKMEYGSVMRYILQERLRWSDLEAKAAPFVYSGDLRVLKNDWPYGIDRKITHLVVWVKFSFNEDCSTGDLTPASRRQIDDYVHETFVKRVGNVNHVKWFKNWAALKSVHAIEHFHVMLYDPDPTLIEALTDGDTAKNGNIGMQL